MANKTINKNLLSSKLGRWTELEQQRLKIAARLDPIVKEQKAIEKEIGALTIPVAGEPPLLKSFTNNVATLTFDTRTERTVDSKKWFEGMTKKEREDDLFWGTYKTLVEKADKFRPVLLAELAIVSVTYKPNLKLQ